jgi:hypothetical protein
VEEREYERMKAFVKRRVEHRQPFTIWPDRFVGCTADDVERALHEVVPPADLEARARRDQEALTWPLRPNR